MDPSKSDPSLLYASAEERNFPNGLNCLDWVRLFRQARAAGQQEDWLEDLEQNGQLVLHVPKDSGIRPAIEHLYFENRNKSAIRVFSHLFLSFPMILTVQGNQLRSTPIFRIPVELKPSFDRPGHWLVRKTVRQNWELHPLIKTQLPAETCLELESMAQARRLDITALQELLQPEEKETVDWADFPGSDQWPDTPDDLRFFPGAILNLAPPFQDLSQSEVELPSRDLTAKPWKYHFARLPLDPSQRSALNRLYRENHLTITGKAGSGKTHLVNFLLENALLNGKRVLLVAGRSSTVYSAQEALHRANLAQFGFGLRNLEQDAPLLANLILNYLAADRTEPESDLDLAAQRLIDQLQQTKSEVDATYRAVQRPVFGQFNWSQSVGLYLRSKSTGAEELSGDQVQQLDLDFTTGRYQQLSRKIDRGEQLFHALGSIRHPLRQLHPRIFQTLNQIEARQFCQSKIRFFLQQFSDLQQAFIGATNTYGNRLRQYFDDYYYQLRNRIDKILEEIAYNEKLYGKDFTQSKNLSLNLLGPFSKRVQQIKQERKLLLNQVEELAESLRPVPDFEFETDRDEEFRTIRQARAFLHELDEALEEWYQEVPVFVQQAVKRLNHKNAVDRLQMNTDLLRLEDRLSQTIELLNETELLANEQVNNMLTLPRMQIKIEDILDLLENLDLNLRDFDAFYDWQAFWLGLERTEQEIIRAIIRIKPRRWVEVFERWYFNELLNRNEMTATPVSDPIPADFMDKINQLQAQIGPLIIKNWQTIRQNSQRNSQELRNALSKPKIDWPALFAEHLNALTSLFPVLMTTPRAAALALQELDQPGFDLVILESAQYIPPQIGKFLMGRGKQSLIIGDDSFVEDDDKPDLLEWALQQNQPVMRLGFTHRYYPANLWQLQRSKRITEAAVGRFSIQLLHPGGTYDPESQTNPEEARTLIKQLMQTPRTPQRTYPRIAVVAATARQRDLLAGTLLELRQTGSFEEREILQQMDRNGLSIFHLQELEGQRFEYLLYSGTFGRPGESTPHDHYQFLNSPDGLRQLSELMSIAYTNICVVNSLPESLLEQWRNATAHPGYFFYANYLKMLDTIRLGKTQLQELILKKLQLSVPESPTTDLNDPLYEEIAERIKPYLPGVTFHKPFQLAHLDLPLVLQSPDPDKPYVALIPDGFFSREAYTDLQWEIKQREKYRDNRIQTLFIYTTSWWKNSEKTAKLLSGAINRIWEV